MGRQVEELFSALARSGPPLFFPDPETPVSYNFDQGLAAPETFPLEDFQRIAAQVLERDGAMALEYFDEAVGYREMIYGYTPLREAIAQRVAAPRWASAPPASPRTTCRSSMCGASPRRSRCSTPPATWYSSSPARPRHTRFGRSSTLAPRRWCCPRRWSGRAAS